MKGRLKFLVTLGIILLVFAFFFGISIAQRAEANTEPTCKFWGNIRKEEYKDTKWRDMDFYESCMVNIKCTYPLKECEY